MNGKTDKQDDKSKTPDHVKDRPWDERAQDSQKNYGFGGGAELDTAAEETEHQEYAAGGLPRTQNYTVDKVGRSHDDAHNERGDRKGSSGCGC